MERTTINRPANRLLFIDNIRIFLTICIVLHHIALTYGARSGWYYYENTGDWFTNGLLTVFLGINRTYILGFFFLISGFFTPGSYDRKGPMAFIKDRLIRLGIPLFLFACIIRPSLIYTMNFNKLGSRYSFWENIVYLKNVAPGPMWFVEVLLVFSFLYVIWVLVAKQLNLSHGSKKSLPGNPAIVVFTLGLAIATFIVRIYYPTDEQIFHLRVGNYPSYVSLFVIGIMAYHNDWLISMTDSTGKFWLKITVVTLCLFVLATVYLGIARGYLPLFRGGLSWQSLLYSALEAFLCVGSTISLPYLFRKRFYSQGKAVASMAAAAYAVYIFHPPIIVYFTYAVKDILTSHPLLKFCLVSIIGVALCFILCYYVIRRLPYAKKVL